jgi:hypothetical protein
MSRFVDAIIDVASEISFGFTRWYLSLQPLHRFVVTPSRTDASAVPVAPEVSSRNPKQGAARNPPATSDCRSPGRISERGKGAPHIEKPGAKSPRRRPEFARKTRPPAGLGIAGNGKIGNETPFLK